MYLMTKHSQEPTHYLFNNKEILPKIFIIHASNPKLLPAVCNLMIEMLRDGDINNIIEVGKEIFETIKN